VTELQFPHTFLPTLQEKKPTHKLLSSRGTAGYIWKKIKKLIESEV